MRQAANEIIVNLMQSDDFSNCMNKVKPSLRDDLKGELSLILLETLPEKIVSLHKKKQLTFYTVRIILRLAFSKTSPFYKKYRIQHDEFTDSGSVDDYSIIQHKHIEERALNEIERLDWYESEMIKLYLECGNYRDMQKKTSIHYSSCFLTVKGAIKKIQKAI